MKKIIFATAIPLLISSLETSGQNTISIKKNYPTIEAVFKADVKNSKTEKYYCFKRDGYVYGFNSKLKEKHIIKNCSTSEWLKYNSMKAQYIYKQDTMLIYPISYGITGEEEVSDFFYQGIMDSTTLRISSIGQPTGNKFKYELFYPVPFVIENR